MKTKYIFFVFLFTFLLVLLYSCEGGKIDYYKEAFELGKKQGFTSTAETIEFDRKAANGWWVNYFHFQPPSTDEEKENYNDFVEGWKDGVDEGYSLSKD